MYTSHRSWHNHYRLLLQHHIRLMAQTTRSNNRSNIRLLIPTSATSVRPASCIFIFLNGTYIVSLNIISRNPDLLIKGYKRTFQRKFPLLPRASLYSTLPTTKSRFVSFLRDKALKLLRQKLQASRRASLLNRKIRTSKNMKLIKHQKIKKKKKRIEDGGRSAKDQPQIGIH